MRLIIYSKLNTNVSLPKKVDVDKNINYDSGIYENGTTKSH